MRVWSGDGGERQCAAPSALDHLLGKPVPVQTPCAGELSFPPVAHERVWSWVLTPDVAAAMAGVLTVRSLEGL